MESTKSTALFPGSYKPPHIGHYLAAKIASQTADKVIVFVGSATRDGITQDMAVDLWELYTLEDDKIEIRVSEGSPVTDVYDFVELAAKNNDTIYFIKGDKDADDVRFKNIEKYAKKIKKTIKKRPINVEDQFSRSGKKVSGTLMRKYINNNDKESFIDGLPQGVNGNAAWNIVTAGYLANIDENITDSKYITIKYKRENALSKSEKFLKLKDVKRKGDYVQASDIKIVDKDTEKEDPKTSGKNKPFANPDDAKNIPDFLKDVKGDILEGVLILTDDDDLKSSKNKTIKINGLLEDKNNIGRKFFAF